MAAVTVKDDKVPINHILLWQQLLSWMTLCQLIRNCYGSSHCHGWRCANWSEIVMVAVTVMDDTVPIDQKLLWQQSLSGMTLCQLIRNFYGSGHCHGWHCANWSEIFMVAVTVMVVDPVKIGRKKLPKMMK